MRKSSTSATLHRLFIEILAASAAVGTTIACGGVTATPTGGLDGGGGDGAVTDPGFSSVCAGVVLMEGPIQVDPPVDYLASRSEYWMVGPPTDGGAPDPESGWKADMGNILGTPCATAPNTGACKAKLDALRLLPTDADACRKLGAPGMNILGCSISYWVYTRGDTIGTSVTDEEKAALVGHVDNVGEALLLAQLKGYSFECFESSVPAQARQTRDGYELIGLYAPNCAKEQYRVHVKVSADGAVTELSRELLPGPASCAVAGRRPEGLAIPTGTAAGPGAWFAEMGALEAASIVAFRRIYRELRAWGAPRTLLQRVREAARDEIRHARSMRALARRSGTPDVAPEIPEAQPRSLCAFAMENAREGCARETYGALLACFQAAHARDPQVRAAMAAIARDETEHAALSWDIAKWVEARLAPEERALVRQTRDEAFRDLARSASTAVTHPSASELGLPSPAHATRLVAELTRGLAA
jgi:hypothetical protein